METGEITSGRFQYPLNLPDYFILTTQVILRLELRYHSNGNGKLKLTPPKRSVTRRVNQIIGCVVLDAEVLALARSR